MKCAEDRREPHTSAPPTTVTYGSRRSRGPGPETSTGRTVAAVRELILRGDFPAGARLDAQGDWGELVPKPAPGEPVVGKQYTSAFVGTSLAATLHAAGVDTVVVAGVSTSGCVRAGAIDALGHGFRPQVVGER